MSSNFSVQAEEAGARLDIYLTEKIGVVSRSQLQKMIKSGQVLLNGRTSTPHEVVTEGDEVTVTAEIKAPAPFPVLTPAPDLQLTVVYEDDEVAVIDKPSGLLVHPTVRGETRTLAAGLIARWPEMAKVGESPERPGIMHRLDMEASGLMVVAKTPLVYKDLKNQFQEHSIEKEYVVLVHDRPPHDEGKIELAIGRASSGDKMAARSKPLEGDRPAVTRYRVDEYFIGSSLLTVRTETGRTHQIRAHFKALGCPVVGDPLYRPKRGSKTNAPRLFLHAKKLAFSRPGDGRRLTFESPLPADLQKTLASLKKI